VNDVSIESIDSHIDGNKYPIGAQNITATVVNNGRNEQSNFEVSCRIEEVTQPEQNTIALGDGFESGLTLWTVDPAGKWEQSSTYANSGTYSAKVLYDANYADYTLTSQNIDLSDATQANFEYYFRGSSENTYDYLYVELKRTTETSWTQLTRYTGTSYETIWTKESFDISSYLDSTIQVRFRFYTDGGVLDGVGWYIDDVTVSKTVPPVTQIVFDSNQTVTTSLAQYATTQLTWSYNFQNATDYIITITTWLSIDESKANDAKSITITIAQIFIFNFKQQGWSFITLPLNTTYETAGELANAIPYCQYIKKWDSAAQSYIVYEKGSAINNFSLENGVGYFVFVTQATDFTIEGTQLSRQTLTLDKGWNSIGRFNETTISASDLAKDIGSNCIAISYWDETLQRFVTHMVGTNIGNFDIERGKGYFVCVTEATIWDNT
jgi:hypothetical protein